MERPTKNPIVQGAGSDWTLSYDPERGKWRIAQAGSWVEIRLSEAAILGELLVTATKEGIAS